MQGTQNSWQPDDSIFDLINGEMRGINRVKEVLKSSGVNIEKHIITSKDEAIISMKEKLKTSPMPQGFSQYQLPVLMGGSNPMFFFTTGEPNAEFPEHMHSRDNGLRVLVSGSISFKGLELTPGDWMYVPKGCSYSFKVGPYGCVLFHKYGPA